MNSPHANRTSFDDLLLVNPSGVRPATEAEVARAADTLGVQLPARYAEFVQWLGAGVLGHLALVVHPNDLVRRTTEWRERVGEYWFWDVESHGVSEEALRRRGVLVADTMDGDELCFDPAHPDALVLVDEDDGVRIFPDLVSALDGMLTVLNPWNEGWSFLADGGLVEVRETVAASDHRDVAAAAEALTPCTRVDFEHSVTLFMPDLEARMSVCDSDAGVSVTFAFDGGAERRAAAVMDVLRTL